MKRRAAAAGTAVLGSAAAYILAIRPWQLGWGATGEERDATLAGDDLIPNPDLVATRAITVHAPPDQVWPWLAQLGQGRGGFYTYDVLENLVGCDIHSADRVVPEWQDIKVGDQVKLHPEVGLGVAVVEQAARLSCVVACRWAPYRPPTTAPGPLSCGSSRIGRPGCWRASAMCTRSGGLGSWSSPLRWSPL